eukprot:gene23987-biopygen4378
MSGLTNVAKMLFWQRERRLLMIRKRQSEGPQKEQAFQPRHAVNSDKHAGSHGQRTKQQAKQNTRGACL